MIFNHGSVNGYFRLDGMAKLFFFMRLRPLAFSFAIAVPHEFERRVQRHVRVVCCFHCFPFLIFLSFLEAWRGALLVLVVGA